MFCIALPLPGKQMHTPENILPRGKNVPVSLLCIMHWCDISKQCSTGENVWLDMWSEMGEQDAVRLHTLANMRQSSKNNEKQFEVLLRCCGGCLCQDSFRSILSTLRGSLNILTRWIELHLRRGWMEMKLLYKAWVALPSTWQSGTCCISKLYNVSQMWGKVKVGVKEKKRGVKPYSWSDNWRCEKTSHGFSSSSRRLSAVLLLEVIVLIVRNVWLPLWEAALQDPQLSQPGDLNSATESSMVRSWQSEICFLLKDGKLGCERKTGCSDILLLTSSRHVTQVWRWSINLRDLYFVNLHWTYFSFL